MLPAMAEASASAPASHRRFGRTARSDTWWLQPLVVFCGLGAFIVYSTWAAFQGNHYYVHPYLSPFYSPVLFTDTSVPGAAPVWHAVFGAWPEWWPEFLPAPPAFFILAFPGAFRFTCYYYRKAYYRSFTGSPPGCALVPAAKRMREYRGEARFLILQNLHRYALYAAICFIGILYYDAFTAFKHHELGFGVGVGSLVLLINATLLACYTFGCHSFRHLIGGGRDELSKTPLRCATYGCVTSLNRRHMVFAWLSLFWVGFSDAYVRLCATGTWTDLRIF